MRQTAGGRLSLDRAKIAAEERLDGKYLITTGGQSLSAGDVVLGHKRLIEAERASRDLKGRCCSAPSSTGKTTASAPTC